MGKQQQLKAEKLRIERDAIHHFLMRKSAQEIEAMAASLDVAIAVDLLALGSDDLVSHFQSNRFSAVGINPPMAHPGNVRLLGDDDRLKNHQLRNNLSPRWRSFRDSLIVQESGLNPDELGSRMETAFQSMAAVVLNRHKEAFEAHNLPNLKAVLKSRLAIDYCDVDATEPRLARGTAFLVAKDLLLTAKHNLYNDKGEFLMAELWFAFDFHENKDGAFPTHDQVQFLRGEKIDEGNGPYDDWALVRLSQAVDRPVLQLTQDKNHPLENTAYYALGFPFGVQLQVAPIGKHVRRLYEERFVASLDLMHGNSGSPIINLQTNLVEGILVAGFDDFEEIVPGQCTKLRRYSENDLYRDMAGEYCQTIASIHSPFLENI